MNIVSASNAGKNIDRLIDYVNDNNEPIFEGKQTAINDCVEGEW